MADQPSAAARVAYIAGSTQPPTGDRIVIGRFEAAGADVTVIDDDLVDNVDLSTYDAIVLATSVVWTTFDASAVDTSLPLLTWEAYLYDELGLAGPGRDLVGETWPRTSVDVVGTGPLAAGLSGLSKVSLSPQGLSWGAPGPGAEIVATVPDLPHRVVMFAYEKGATMADGRAAPGARVTLFPDYFMGREIAAPGVRLVDAAVAWLLERIEIDDEPTTTTTSATTSTTSAPTTTSTTEVDKSTSVTLTITGDRYTFFNLDGVEVTVAGAAAVKALQDEPLPPIEVTPGPVRVDLDLSASPFLEVTAVECLGTSAVVVDRDTVRITAVAETQHPCTITLERHSAQLGLNVTAEPVLPATAWFSGTFGSAAVPMGSTGGFEWVEIEPGTTKVRFVELEGVQPLYAVSNSCGASRAEPGQELTIEMAQGTMAICDFVLFQGVHIDVTQLVLGSTPDDTYPVEIRSNGSLVGESSAPSEQIMAFPDLPPGDLTVIGFPSTSDLFARYECTSDLRAVSGLATTFVLTATLHGERITCSILTSAAEPL